MAPGTDFCEITNGEIENKCDVFGADCNGSTKLPDANVNVTGNSDSSYEFVGEVTPDTVKSSVNEVANDCKTCLPSNDVEIQVDESGGGVDCCMVESYCIVAGKLNGGEVVNDFDRRNDVANKEVNGSIVREVVEPVCDDCQVTDDEVVELESRPNAVENVECQVSVNEVRKHVVEASEADPVFEAEKVRETVVEASEADPVFEAEKVWETVVEASEADPVFEAEKVWETVVEAFETPLVVEAKEVREPVFETFEPASVVEVQEFREPLVEASEAESVVETQEVRESVEAGGAMAMPEAKITLEFVVCQTSERIVTLEADGSKLPEVEEVGEVKSEDKSDLISNGQVDESKEPHLASRSVDNYEEKLEEENMTEIGNQKSPALFTSEVDRSINEDQMGTQLGDDFEDDQVLDSGDLAQLKAETAVDPAFNEDQVSKPEEVSEHFLELQKDTHMNVDHEDSQVLSSVDLVRSGTVNETEDPLEIVIVSDPTINEIEHSKAEDVRECINECLNGIQLNKSPRNAQILPSMMCVGPETESESEVPPETVIAGDFTPSKNQVSLIKECSICVGESQENTHLNKGPEVAQSLPSAICVRSETMDETEVPLETESNSKLISNEKAQIFSSTDCVRSESRIGNIAVENGESFCTGSNDSRILDNEVEDGTSPITENVPTFSTDYSNHGAEIERCGDKNGKDGLFCSANDSKSEFEVENSALRGDNKSAHPEERLWSKRLFPRQKAQKACTLSRNDVELEVPNGENEPTNGSACGYHLIDTQQNESLPDLKSEFEVEHSSDMSSTDLPSNGALNPTSEILTGSVGGMETVMLNSSQKVEDELSGDGVTCDKETCMENVVIDDGVQSDGMPTTLPESSVSDATDGQDVDTEVISNPFFFLMKFPRYEDDKNNEEIGHAQQQVDEKTQQREAIRAEIQNKRTNCHAHRERFEAAKAEERTTRRSVMLKRQEIDSLQSIINRVKNAISVEDIDNRIYGMEYAIQHETLPLKEEKEFIREIKRLKHLQKELSSNMGSQDEVQHALDQKDQNEDHLKKLKKELETLKDMVLKAEAVKISSGKKYDEESKKLIELQAQFKASNDIRQEAYEHLLRLRGQLYAKNKKFGVYKDDAAAANGYASRKDKKALHHMCVNQVEQLMKLWNTDGKFRKEYVRCNMRSIIKRSMTLDSRKLNPGEEPPVLPPYVDERFGRKLTSVPSQIKSVSVVANVEQEKQVSSAGEKQVGKNLIEEVMKQKIKSRGSGKPAVVSGSASVSGRDKKVEDKKEEEEKELLAKKAEELRKFEEELMRKAEIVAKAQRWLEEKTKAQEALERKKRNSEKAQKKAEWRAQKEAEEREKAMEKRLRKKEKKKSGSGNAVVNDNNSNAEDGAADMKALEVKKESNSNSSIGTSKKQEAKKPSAAWFAKQKKISKPTPIPAPLLKRGRRRIQPWMGVVIVAVFVIVLLFFSAFFPNLKLLKL